MPRFQFSLWWLMVVMTIACVLLFLGTFGGLLDIVAVSILWCLVPTPLFTLAIYGRGDFQAFAIGALVPWATLVLFRTPAPLSFFTAFLWLLPMGALCGVVAAGTRRWIRTNLRDDQ